MPKSFQFKLCRIPIHFYKTCGMGVSALNPSKSHLERMVESQWYLARSCKILQDYLHLARVLTTYVYLARIDESQWYLARSCKIIFMILQESWQRMFILQGSWKILARVLLSEFGIKCNFFFHSKKDDRSFYTL